MENTVVFMIFYGYNERVTYRNLGVVKWEQK